MEKKLLPGSVEQIGNYLRCKTMEEVYNSIPELAHDAVRVMETYDIDPSIQVSDFQIIVKELLDKEAVETGKRYSVAYKFSVKQFQSQDSRGIVAQINQADGHIVISAREVNLK